jgi:GH15 family glucan-1,4-alpha-glucosidase
MARIEEYALIGDMQTAALVGKDSSIDWLCPPRFDSAPCFAAFLGTPDHGRWLRAPAVPVLSVTRLLRNFPQASSDVSRINTAHNLAQASGPAQHRRDA